MLLRIDHETTLSYSEPATESVVEVRVTPPSTRDQTVLGQRLQVAPAVPLTAFRDGFGNRADLFTVFAPHRRITVSASCCVRVERRPGSGRLAEVPWSARPAVEPEAVEFLRPSSLAGPSAELHEFLSALPPPAGSVANVVEGLMRAVRSRLEYRKEVTNANTPVAESLALGRGVCQDFAHLLLAAARGVGLPARYISGYVNEPGEIATHAWCQIWGGPAAGWVDVDPTRGLWVCNDHVVTAVGRDFSDVPPNRGVWKGGRAEETIGVVVSVRPVEEVPAELTEPPPAPWVARAGRGGGAPSPQQARRGTMRQQQSQQQQTWCNSPDEM